MRSMQRRPRLVVFDPCISGIGPADHEEWACFKAGADELGVRTMVALPPGMDHWAPGLEFVRLPRGDSGGSTVAMPNQKGIDRTAMESRLAAESVAALLEEAPLSEDDVLLFPKAGISLALGLANVLASRKSVIPRTVLLFRNHLAEDARDLGLNPAPGWTALEYALALLSSSRNASRIRFFTTTEDLAEEYGHLTGLRFQTAPWPLSPQMLEVRRRTEGVCRILSLPAFDSGPETIRFIGGLVGASRRALSSRKVKWALLVPPEAVGGISGRPWKQIRDFAGVEVHPNNLSPEDRLRLLGRTDLLILPPQPARHDLRCFQAAIEAGAAGIPLLMPEESNLAKQLLMLSRGALTYLSANPEAALFGVLDRFESLRETAAADRERLASAFSAQRFARFVCGVEVLAAAESFSSGMARSGIRVDAARPVAVDSPDHVTPHGTSRDNSRNYQFNRKLFALFKTPRPAVLDLGCSGGGFVKSCLDDGHVAVGIEGSDYSLRLKRAEWKTIPEFLFTGDVTYPFTISRSGSRKAGDQRFDVVTSWELIEHIRSADLPRLCDNVLRHLAPHGVWIMSISPQEEVIRGVRLHQTVQPRSWWVRFFRSAGLVHSDELETYFGEDWVRGPNQQAVGSFHLVLHRRGEKPPAPPQLPRIGSRRKGTKA